MARVKTQVARAVATAPLPSPFEDAELYDTLFGDLDFDRSFYVALAKGTAPRGAGAGPVLEVTCGTGRVLIPILEAGVEIEGLDLEPRMLERLRAKARSLGFSPRVHQADMRSFALPRRYALVIIPFNGFVHCLTTDDQLGCLRACREHLAPGGRLVMNTMCPYLDLDPSSEGIPVLEHEAPHPRTGLPVRIYDTRTRDRVAQIQHSEIEIQELDAAGRVAASHRSATDMRWTYRPEMDLLLRAAGFARWEIAGGFDHELLAADSSILLVTAWKD